jgi:hypothetical protein
VSEIAQGVLDAGWHLWIDGAGDDAIGLEGTETVGQDLLADAVQALSKFIEPSGTHQEIPEYQQLPFAADQLYGGRNRALL